ncbi:MAG: FecR domain-containing protein [bacterium]|nr:FecR domain-containing protein [bacterium]
MTTPKYPKKGTGSYLLPFILIIVLAASGWYFLQEKVNIQDFLHFLQPPEVAKDEKVQIVFQEGKGEIKPWNDQSWSELSEETFLEVGDTLKTQNGGSMVLRFFDDSEVRLASNSQLKLIRLDKDEFEGNHLALELISGQLWRRGTAGNTEDSDFILNTTHQIVLMNQNVMLNVSSNPETTRVVGGEATINVAQRTNGARIPISRLELSAGEQVIFDLLVIDQLKTGDKDVVTPIDQDFYESEWYQWNMDKEEKLGFIAEASTVVSEPEIIEPLAEGLVIVSSPQPEQKTGNKILVQGSYDATRVSHIWVNGQEATLGLEGEWEQGITLTEERNSVTVTSLEIDSTKKKQAAFFNLQVDSSGPGLGKVTQPEVDENGNGIVGDKLELIGEITGEATKVCVSHNDGTPYCLKEFKPGNPTYRYLGGVTYGNVVTGQNKYRIQAWDELGNESSKTVYLFKDVPKPDAPVRESSSNSAETTTVGTESESSDVSKPVITNPDPSQTFQTSEQKLTISGTLDPKTNSLLVNDKKASYQTGSSTFSVTLDLSLGENTIRVQAVDAQGNKSKTALLKVMYFVKPSSPPQESADTAL